METVFMITLRLALDQSRMGTIRWPLVHVQMQMIQVVTP